MSAARSAIGRAGAPGFGGCRARPPGGAVRSHTRLSWRSSSTTEREVVLDLEMGVAHRPVPAQPAGLLDQVPQHCAHGRLPVAYRHRPGPSRSSVSVRSGAFPPRHGNVNAERNLGCRRASRSSRAVAQTVIESSPAAPLIRRGPFMAGAYRLLCEHVPAGDGRRPGRAPAARSALPSPLRVRALLPVPGRRPSPAGPSSRRRPDAGAAGGSGSLGLGASAVARRCRGPEDGFSGRA